MSDVAASNEWLTLQLLAEYKQHFARHGDHNESPFVRDQIVRYDTDVRACDVPAIHQRTRQRIEEILTEMRHGIGSQVILLTGNPGAGKSHLINCFRDAERARQLGYVLVCNSNHWKAAEFEECLLDWILAAIVGSDIEAPHPLFERIKDIAFQALRQILDRPGELERYQVRRRSLFRFMDRFWQKLTGADHARFIQAIEERNIRIFRRVDFAKFARYVCQRFLVTSGNIFHRYVVHVLLRYLFDEDREKVIHWLRCQPVGDYFLRRLEMGDQIDRQYKRVEVIKILISLFSPEVSSKLEVRPGQPCQPLLFFFAFDQAEAREELFENDTDWRIFFAQLSELYNTLPNVLILFTMTLGLRNRLIERMEGQFKSRLRNEDYFILGQPEPSEILSFYQRRVSYWLGERRAAIEQQLQQLGNPYHPFDQQKVLTLAQTTTLRDLMVCWDTDFRRILQDAVIDVPLDFQVYRNELRQQEQTTTAFEYTKDHLQTVEKVFGLFGEVLTSASGLKYQESEWQETEQKVTVLRLQFCDAAETKRWVRVFLVRLGFFFNDKTQGCLNLLFNREKAKYQLWVLRCPPVPPLEREGFDVQCRPLLPPAETDLQAVVRILEQRAKYQPKAWQEGERYLLQQIRQTYLGELLDRVRDMVQRLPVPSSAGSSSIPATT